MSEIIKIPDKVDLFELASIEEKISMKHAIIHFKDGTTKKYWLCDTTPYDDSETGKNQIDYITDRYRTKWGDWEVAGNCIDIDLIDSIELLE